jgi:hypothetical protein
MPWAPSDAVVDPRAIVFKPRLHRCAMSEDASKKDMQHPRT